MGRDICDNAPAPRNQQALPTPLGTRLPAPKPLDTSSGPAPPTPTGEVSSATIPRAKHTRCEYLQSHVGEGHVRVQKQHPHQGTMARRGALALGISLAQERVS